jgi:hypothetical protein
MKTIKLFSPIFLVLAVLLSTGFAQKPDKKWTEWTKKEAQKMLDDSPWGQAQTDTDTSEMFFTPTRQAGAGLTKEERAVNTERSETGATNQSVNVTFRVRFFSARPIRQALARLMEINQNLDPKTAPEAVAKLQAFGDLKSTNSIIVTVMFESPDQRYSAAAMQTFNSATTGTLKNETYLQRSDGEKLFLEEYVPPGKDGFGARFIFLRDVNGQPFITDKSSEIRFYTKYPNELKIDRRFKVANMKYQGELEY